MGQARAGEGAKQLPFPCVPLYFPRGLVCAILDADRTEDSTPRRAAFGGDITCGRYAISHAQLCEKYFLADGAPQGEIRKNPNKIGVFAEKKFYARGLTAGRGYSILEANQGAYRALRNNNPRPAEPGRNEETK